jgi:hypothetical protein
LHEAAQQRRPTVRGKMRCSSIPVGQTCWSAPAAQQRRSTFADESSSASFAAWFGVVGSPMIKRWIPQESR